MKNCGRISSLSTAAIWKKVGIPKFEIVARNLLMVALGPVCSCCGSAGNLEIDHVKPQQGKRDKDFARRSLFQLRQGAPHNAQVLCRECNRFKDIGPRCPCKWWDEISSGWRG